uniref:Membrane atpase/protein kinase n=1 Tax=Rhipicephalus appendiculatus TaxID=34631 RepID=A0A131YLE4_RHIAP
MYCSSTKGMLLVSSRTLRSLCRRVHTKPSAEAATESARVRRLFDGLASGERAALAQSITLVESTARRDHDEAQHLLQLVLQENKARRKGQLGSFRIGTATTYDDAVRQPSAVILTRAFSLTKASRGRLERASRRLSKLSANSSPVLATKWRCSLWTLPRL